MTTAINAATALGSRPLIPRRKPLTARVGLFGVGHSAYWPQFEGLLDEMHRKLAVFAGKVRAQGVEVHNFGIVDNARGAYRLRDQFMAASLDLIFCDMVTYATSATFGAIVREGDPEVDAEIAQWCAIARVLHDLKSARIGYFGHVLENMLDLQTDHTALTAAFGCHVVQTEPEDLMRHFRRVTDGDADAMKRRVLDLFDTPDPKSDPVTRKVTPEDLDIAARSAVALERFVDEQELDGLAYYYEGEPDSLMRQLVTNLIVGNSLLTAAGFPMCGEADLKTCVAMLIEDRLDIGGSFAEFHPVDFKEGFVLVGHDGPHHLNIADGKPVLRSLIKYHGKPGSGASVEFRIKEGPITMLGIGVTYGGRFKFIIGEGQSVKGPIPPTGNTNTRGFFEPDVKTFLKRWVAEGPTHHFALGIGHHGGSIQKIGEVLGLDTALISRERVR